jgi:hypothetical protein
LGRPQAQRQFYIQSKSTIRPPYDIGPVRGNLHIMGRIERLRRAKRESDKRLAEETARAKAEAEQLRKEAEEVAKKQSQLEDKYLTSILVDLNEALADNHGSIVRYSSGEIVLSWSEEKDDRGDRYISGHRISLKIEQDGKITVGISMPKLHRGLGYVDIHDRGWQKHLYDFIEKSVRSNLTYWTAEELHRVDADNWG